MITLEPVIEMPCVMSGAWRGLGVHVFEGKVTLADMDVLERRGDAWARKNPGSRVEMTIILPSNTQMTSEERTRMVRIIKRWEHVRTASAMVILATGLVGAGHRSVLTGLLLFAPPPHPAKVFGAVHTAVDWIAPYVQSICGAEATSPEIKAAVDVLVDRFRAFRAAHLETTRA